MPIAAVMQLFTCPFDNDTSHVQLYLTLGMLLCRMTHICFHRNRRFQHGLCNWIWWICPFLDNRVVQLWGHQRALTPSWPMLRPPVDAAGWTDLSHCLIFFFIYIFCVHVCVFVYGCRRFQSLGDPIWQPESSPSPPAVRHLLLFLHSSSWLLTQPTASYSNLLPHQRGSPASLLSSPLQCAQQQSWCISKHFI